MELHIEKEGRKWLLWLNNEYVGMFSASKLIMKIVNMMVEKGRN